MKLSRIAVPLMSLLLASTPAANAQTVTGSVSGTVADSAGSVVVGARVQLINDISKQTREFQTSGAGEFEFSSIIPGPYLVKIVQPGFRPYEQSVTISAQERVDLHTIKLAVGDVTMSISVQAETAHVATDSSDRSQNVNLQQIADTPIRGRDFKAIVKTLPGVQDLDPHDSHGWGTAVPTINGGQMGQVVVTLDGIVSQDSGNYYACGLASQVLRKYPIIFQPSLNARADVAAVGSSYVRAASAATPVPQMASGTRP